MMIRLFPNEIITQSCSAKFPKREYNELSARIEAKHVLECVMRVKHSNLIYFIFHIRLKINDFSPSHTGHFTLC